MRITGLFFSWKLWVAAAVVLIGVIGFSTQSATISVLLERLTPPELPAAATPKTIVQLDQNWPDKDRRKFHHISQGTSTFPVPLNWLLALEQPESSVKGLLLPGAKPRFFETNYLRRFGFIPSPASQENPHELPIGFAVTGYQNLPGVPGLSTALGLSCAACHTGHFTYKDTEYVVDGGPSTVDLDALTNAMGAALGQTMLSAVLPTLNRRFNRFAREVLGETYGAASRQQLESDLKAALMFAKQDRFNVLEGHGRLDALNRIGNQVFSQNVNRPQNYTPISAPVNFPHIWTAMWFDWVQYDGSIMQPLVRNAGEALGVHAHVNMSAPVDGGRFASAVPVENLDWIENTLSGKKHPEDASAFGGLLSPKWPDGLPPIDTALRDKGEHLYEKHCSGCHLPPIGTERFWSGNHFRKIHYKGGGVDRVTEQPYLALNIIPLEELGTDPGQSLILMSRTIDTAADASTGVDAMGLDAVLCIRQPGSTNGEDYAKRETSHHDLIETRVTDSPSLNFGLALAALVQNVNNAWFEAALIPEDKRGEFEGNRPNCLQATAGYKARPLNGVWATAPFLHNGSVPTLDDLLRPVDERPKYVQLGSLEFDPDKVGIKQPILSGQSYGAYQNGLFILDTSLPGNLNTGHGFGASANGNTRGVIGPGFSDDERAAIIEFLKSI